MSEGRDDWVRRVLCGEVMAEIADEVGLSTQRVQQVVAEAMSRAERVTSSVSVRQRAGPSTEADRSHGQRRGSASSPAGRNPPRGARNIRMHAQPPAQPPAQRVGLQRGVLPRT